MLKSFKKFLSVVLVLTLCITCNVLPVYAIEAVDTLSELSSSELYEDKKEDIVESTETKKLVLPDTFMSYIDKSEFESHKFTDRLVEQEKLNTYVFQNADNTKAVYYFDENLKYIDDKGQVVEKDLSIIEAESGYTIKKSDIDINLPTTPTSGIAVGYDDFSISIIPISASKLTSSENIKAEKADGSIVYNGVFGSNTKLVYTPILSGLKEDIILSEYVPNTKFSFTIKTNGLSMVEKDGQYFLAEAEKSEPIFKLGDVVAYDAVGKPSIGSMTVKTVKDCSEYIITLEVDGEFLKDSTTIYPVTIDPSITVSDNANGAGAIEDAPVYEGYPTTNFGSYLFNPVGTPSADFGKGRTVVRLTGLISSDEYEGITANQITNVTFYVREGSGSSQNVNIYPLISNTTWTESNVTRNNVGLYMSSECYVRTLSGGQVSGLDITDLVKKWKDGTFPSNGGFIMIGTDESVNRNFLSSEYSTTSYRPYVVMTYDAVISIAPTNVTIVEGNTRTLVATTRPSGLTVTWSTSDSSIAEVDSDGVVRAKNIGSATITATTVSTDGVSYSAYCTVCVTIPDGVYYIKNKNSNYYLTTNGTITGTPDVYQFSQYISTIPELVRIRQMWKIKHLGNGKYSVRPYNKLDMGLHVADDNASLTLDNVDITNIGTTDTIGGVSPSATWAITNAFGGYIFENYDTNSYLQIASSSTALNASVITHFFSMSNNCLWDLEPASSPPSGAYLFDVAENAIVNTSTRAIKVGQSKNLSDFGLIAVAYSAGNISQSFNWSTGDSDVATVNANDLVTGISDGKATITGVACGGDNYNHITYTICVGFPDMFENFINTNNITADNLDLTDDGLFLTTTPISTILLNNGINYLPDGDTSPLDVNKYYDDWYVYAVKDGSNVKYGLYKMREEENDQNPDGDDTTDADADDPGVTISFVAFDGDLLAGCCLYYEMDEKKYELYQALTKSIGPDEYFHSDILAGYFADASSDGAYLIAEKAINFFANCFSGNVIIAPQNLTDMFVEYEALLDDPNPDEDDLEWCRRVPEALDLINTNAKIDSGNNELEIFREVSYPSGTYYTITVQDKNNLTIHEQHAILACFTGDVTFNSFAAEVEFHAECTENIASNIAYGSAIRADMAIGETYMRGFAEPYYELDSEIVQGQVAAHGEY